MHYKETVFSYYPSNIKITKPAGNVTLEQMLNSIKSPRPETIEIFKEIERVSALGDLKTKAELKSKLWYFTPCVQTNGLGRSYSDVVAFNNLLVLDFDNLEPQEAAAFQEFLFNEYSYIISTMLSASKKGVKAIVRLEDIKTVDEFKSSFYAVAAEMEKYSGFDPSSQNPVLSFYLTYSPSMLYRDNATIFTGKGFKKDSFKVYEGEIETVEDVSEEDREKIRNILRWSMEKITDSGHFLCRSTCIAGFGYAGAGYFTTEEMRDFLYELIENTPYLQKSLSTYKKTCDDMSVRGIQSPLYLQ